MRAPLTPIKAFVLDAATLSKAGEASSVDDPRLSQWLSVAQAADRLAELKPAQRSEYAQMLGHSVLPFRAERPTLIEGDGRTPTDAISELGERLRLEAEDMERAGCFELALTTVSSVCQMLARGSLTARLLATAHLGRVTRQIGELRSAVDCYTTVTNAALAINDGPVAAHGFIGLGNVAFARGNRPAQKAFFLRALELAVQGSPVELSAHQGLMVTANQQGELADALLHGWRAHDLAPQHSESQLEIINNLSSTALYAGFYAAALSGYDFVIQKSSIPRTRLPAIDGGIRAAARSGERNRVQLFEQLGRDELKRGAAPYDAARFLFCAAEAHQFLQESHLAKPLLAESIALADNFGFYELSIRGDAMLDQTAVTRSTNTQTTFVVVDSSDPIVQNGIGRLSALSMV